MNLYSLATEDVKICSIDLECENNSDFFHVWGEKLTQKNTQKNTTPDEILGEVVAEI